MSHRFFYVYELKGDVTELDVTNKSPIEIDGTDFRLEWKSTDPIRKELIRHYYFKNQKEINGDIVFKEKKVPFKIRSKSKLLFVETPYQKEKIKILKFFKNKFKRMEINSFVPTDEEEKDFICHTADYSNFKVFIDNKVISSNKNEKNLCKGLMSNMELIEATLDLLINDKRVRFYYYGNAIQFPHPEEEDIEGVFQAFENTMIAPAK